MRKNVIYFISVCIFLMISSSIFAEGNKSSDKIFDSIITEYIKITDTLSKDKTKDVKKNSKKIVTLLEELDKTKFSSRGKDYKNLLKKMAKGAKKLAKAKNIARMRKSLKKLSTPLVKIVEIEKPVGINVALCTMYKGGAKWLMHGKNIENPYWGSAMYSCGDVVYTGPKGK